MPPIRIAKHLDSDTLHLPELRPLIGRDVEIIVRDATVPAVDEWRNGPSIEEIIRRQGVKPISSIADLAVPELRDAFEGFDEAREQWRLQDIEARRIRDQEMQRDLEGE
jgi:hypothetical protein